MKRLLAWLFGYFYLPCPACGKMFAGFEAGMEVVFCTDNRAYAVCKRCDPVIRMARAWTMTKLQRASLPDNNRTPHLKS